MMNKITVYGGNDIMKTYEQNKATWDKIVEEITHPLHKSILVNFHSDLYQDIVYLIEAGDIQKDFDSIMNYVTGFIAMHLEVQVKTSNEYNLLEIVLGNDLDKKMNELFNTSNVTIEYSITNFLPEEEFKALRLSDDYDENEDDDVYATLEINLTLNESQIAMLELTNANYRIGRIVEEFTNVYYTYINGIHCEEFER